MRGHFGGNTIRLGLDGTGSARYGEVGAVNSVMTFQREVISVATPIGKERHGTVGMAGPGLVWAVNSGKHSLQSAFRWQHHRDRQAQVRLAEARTGADWQGKG